MKAIILAGGFGTRIQPLTNSIPKPMLPILNKPMMEHIIVKLRDELNITEMAVLLFFKPDIIKDYFKDGSELGVNLQYVQPDDDYGTAGAVAFARDFLDDTFIIVSGDLVTNFDFKKIEKFHKKNKSKLTITLTSVEDPLQFGVVIANEENKIERFLEKPSWGEVFSDTINTGIYVIEPEILDYIPYKENFDFAKDLFPTLMENNVDLWGFSLDGYWRDVGNPQSYREVYQDLFNEKIKLNIQGEQKTIDKATVYLGENVSLNEKVRLSGTVILGDNVKISEGVTLHNVCIGNNVKVKKHSEIVDSILWNDVAIGSKVKIYNSVICNDCTIKDETKIPLGVVMAEHCEVGKKSSFEKDITIWPDKVIDANSIVSNNIIWGTKYKSSIFENGKVVGRTNIELSVEMSIKIAESFGSILPVGSSVYISRDYQNSSRMLKRAFVSGLLATGINVVNLYNAPSNVMRYRLSFNEEASAGIHFRQSVEDPMNTEIILYTSDGLAIDAKLASSIEKVFFKENFRRVNLNQIGDISQEASVKKQYVNSVLEKLDHKLLQESEVKIAADIMFGSTSDIYPKIMNALGVENILLNAHKDDKNLSKAINMVTKSQKDMCNIVNAMNLDCGFIIYPNGQKLQIIDDNGDLVYDYVALLAILKILNITTKEKLNILLPAWAPDFIEFENLNITRDKLSSMKSTQLQEFDLIATTDGHFAFCQFGLNTDAVFASCKILELIQLSEQKLSKIVQSLPKFVFKGENVYCPTECKGRLMRKFLEDSKSKETSSVDGVKIWINEDEWILMVPDNHANYLNLYIQAENEKNASKIFWKYNEKIEKWISECK